MKKNIFCVAIIVAMLLFVFSSCSSPFTSAETLIRPPRLTGVNAQLQSAFENAVMDKGDIILKSPAGGSYRSAYCVYDYDSDMADEAVVFYSLSSSEDTVYMNILDKVGDEWVSVNDILGDGNGVESVDFVDLNNDGICEILVSYSIIDSKNNKKLTVYSRSESASGEFASIAIEPYTQMYFVDIDMDSNKEIALAYLDSNAEQYTSVINFIKLSSDGQSVYAFAQTPLYSENTGFAAISSDVKGGVCYLYVDEIANGSYVTEIIYWDKEEKRLVKPVDVDLLTLRNCPTARLIQVTCSDINDDGMIEIPTAKHLNDSKIISKYNESLNQQLNLITWYSYSGTDFVKVKEYIRNSSDGYTVQLAENLIDSVSVIFDADNHNADFYFIDKTGNKTQLFSISAILITDPVDEDNGTYLKSGSVYSYYCKLYESCAEHDIDLQTINQALQIADEF